MFVEPNSPNELSLQRSEMSVRDKDTSLVRNWTSTSVIPAVENGTLCGRRKLRSRLTE
jgi:hypothetical protein